MTNKDSLVSVVIPTYNCSQLIGQTIRSVLQQTYNELEIIIVDDGSTDDTQERIAALQEDEKRIRYLRHDSNRSAQAARNTGIQAANGKYIAFLDSDNEWLPQKLEEQMALFFQKTDSIGVVYCGL